MSWRHYHDFQTTWELNEFLLGAGDFTVQHTTRWPGAPKTLTYRCSDFQESGCPFVIRVEHSFFGRSRKEGEDSAILAAIQVFLKGSHKNCGNGTGEDVTSNVEEDDDFLIEDVHSEPEGSRSPETKPSSFLKPPEELTTDKG